MSEYSYVGTCCYCGMNVGADESFSYSADDELACEECGEQYRTKEKDINDWILAADHELKRRGLPFHQCILETLGMLSLLTRRSPFEKQDFNPFEPTTGCLGDLVAQLHHSSTELEVTIMASRHSTREFKVTNHDYSPGDNYELYSRELAVYLDAAGLETHLGHWVSWSVMNCIGDGDPNLISGAKEIMKLFLEGAELVNAVDLLDTVVVSLGEIVGKIAGDQDHEYLKTLALIVESQRTQYVPALASPCFGLTT